MQSWRFLDTGHRDGAWNMAVDEALLLGVAAGTSPPTVRVFGWQPPTVSTGHSQDVESELDLDACAAAGVGVVRRPTGGRAVLHAGELTYAVVAPAGVLPLGNSIMEDYRVIAGGLIEGLSILGVTAELATVVTDPRGEGDGPSPPCFVSAGRYEIVVDGRKLVGSAQRRSSGAVLQHGSLLTDDTHLALADLLRVRNERQRKMIRRSLRAKTTDLACVLGRPAQFDEVARAMRLGFERAWGLSLVQGTLDDVESEAAARLATEHGTWA